MVKILFFHLGFYFSGGGEKLVLEEIKGLEDRGFEVVCFSPIVDKNSCFPDEIDKLPIYPMLPQLPDWFPKRHTVQLLLTCFLFPLFSWRYRNYDICFAANQPSLYFAYFLKRFYGIPYVGYLAQPLRLLHPRNIDKESGLFIRYRSEFLPKLAAIFRPFIDWADKKSTKQADRILVNGEYVKKLVDKTYNVKAINCPAGSYPVRNPVSYKGRLKGKIKANSHTIKKPYILLTNRHFPQKKFEYAISALAIVLGVIPEVKLVITGEEMEYTKTLKEFVREMGLQDNVVFTGLVKEADLRKLYKNAAVYVYTAPEEDFGMGIIEAMAAGTPVVAWNNGGPKYILKGTSGEFLSKQYDIKEYSDKIISALECKKTWTERSKELRKLANDRYSYSSHFEGIIEELEELLK